MLASFASWLSVLLLAACASAQQDPVAVASDVSTPIPSDDSQHVVLQFSNSRGLTNSPYDLISLTPNATAVLTSGPSAVSGLSGQLKEVTISSPTPSTTSQVIALISCDASQYRGNIVLNDLVSNTLGANVSAIVFYSQEQTQCILTGNLPDGFVNVYTTASNRSAQEILTEGASSSPDLSANILTETALQHFHPSGGNTTPNSPPGGPTTAVAMIILYSITGVITALFLIIIITGAIRAHRHPERYGPRNIIGRARQSRAKGIARAMLETIPIVKFGDDATAKDVELSDSLGAGQVETQPSTISGAEHLPTTQQPKDTASAEHDPAPPNVTNPATDDDNTPTCSICTEDFERGQDIRVLPCNHRFHPACVDPWLLEVSGTCPLCRVDLRPTEPTGSNVTTGDMPPPLDPSAESANNNSPGGRLRGLLRRLQPSTAEERIAALRRFREENPHSQSQIQGQDSEHRGAADEAHRSRWERVLHRR